MTLHRTLLGYDSPSRSLGQLYCLNNCSLNTAKMNSYRLRSLAPMSKVLRSVWTSALEMVLTFGPNSSHETSDHHGDTSHPQDLQVGQ